MIVELGTKPVSDGCLSWHLENFRSSDAKAPFPHTAHKPCKSLSWIRMSKSIIEPGLLGRLTYLTWAVCRNFSPTSWKGLNMQMLEEDLQRFTQDYMAPGHASQVQGQWPHCHLLSTLPALGMLQGSSGFGVSLLILDMAWIQEGLPAEEEKMQARGPKAPGL